MLGGFNELPAERAERELLACCAAPDWARALAAGRPYPDLAAALAAADAATAELSWDGIAQALAAHPRIGERQAGAGREAAWSRREQGGMATAGEETAAALVAANQAYEEKFGHIFLIFASGRTPAEMLAAARARLANDPATERDVVREELRKIARLRLERLLGSASGRVGGSLSTHVLDTGRGAPAAGVPVRLELTDGTVVAEGVTDADGRLRDWVPADRWRAGAYRLIFDTAAYLGAGAFFPEVSVVFQVADPERHYHVPLLLSPFGYTTYRGS